MVFLRKVLEKLLESIAELRALTNTWLRIYNSERPTTASAGLLGGWNALVRNRELQVAQER